MKKAAQDKLQCSYCNKPGQTEDRCRKKRDNQKNESEKPTEGSPIRILKRESEPENKNDATVMYIKDIEAEEVLVKRTAEGEPIQKQSLVDLEGDEVLINPPARTLRSGKIRPQMQEQLEYVRILASQCMIERY